MNYEELVETRDVRKSNKVKMPFGYFHKRQIDGKYSNFVEFLDELSDNILFAECLKKDCEVAAQISDKHQLHFTPNAEEGSDGIYAVAVEPGNYLTMGQLLNEVPAVVAQKGFLENTIKDLLEITVKLNEKGVQQVCFAPSNVFVRRNDYDVRLLLHGSPFHRLSAYDTLYEGVEEYIAPEVLRGEAPTDRSDVYGLGKFIDYLNASSGMPFYLKSVIKKATAEDPDARYATVGDLRKALSQRKATFKSAVTALSAIAIALILVGLFFTLTPDTEMVEFVKPVEEPISEELLDEGFDPSTELGAAADSATIAAAIKDYQMKVYPPSRTDGEVVKANIWNWSEGWSQPEWSEDGVSWKPMEFTPGIDPDYYDLFATLEDQTTRKYCTPSTNAFLFSVTPSAGCNGGQVRVTDLFGNTYIENIKW